MTDSTDDGLCLRRADYGEFDAVVTFLTRQGGKRPCAVKGVRRPRSRNAPVCQLFVHSRLQIVAGRGLARLAQAEVIDSFYALREDLWQSARATYCCELADRAVPDDEPQEALYELLLETLTCLCAAEDGRAPLHSFELRLTALLGYEPVLHRCARCGEPIEERTAAFCPAAGGLVHLEDTDPRDEYREVSPRLVKAMRRLLDPARYGVDLLCTQIPEALADDLREAIRAHLRYHLDTEPKSAAFLDQLLKLESG